jgi:hypothetical protein
MAYATMDPTALILLAVEFIGRGHPVPSDMADFIDPDVLADLNTPEVIDDRINNTTHPPN